MGHRDLLVTQNLSDAEHHSCRPYPRGSVRRASGFVLTGYTEVDEGTLQLPDCRQTGNYSGQKSAWRKCGAVECTSSSTAALCDQLPYMASAQKVEPLGYNRRNLTLVGVTIVPSSVKPLSHRREMSRLHFGA